MVHIAVQAFLNIGVTLNLLPNTGIGLPFISYGGTAILCLMMEMALVCSIARKNYIKRMKQSYIE
jgi:cell division protein FtsW